MFISAYQLTVSAVPKIAKTATLLYAASAPSFLFDSSYIQMVGVTAQKETHLVLLSAGIRIAEVLVGFISKWKQVYETVLNDFQSNTQ